MFRERNYPQVSNRYLVSYGVELIMVCFHAHFAASATDGMRTRWMTTYVFPSFTYAVLVENLLPSNEGDQKG